MKADSSEDRSGRRKIPSACGSRPKSLYVWTKRGLRGKRKFKQFKQSLFGESALFQRLMCNAFEQIYTASLTQTKKILSSLLYVWFER